MGILSDFTKKIRNAIYVKDVRDAIADGLETVEALEEKNLETYNNMVIGAGESNAEIVDARLDNNTGIRYEKVGKRLDKISSEIDEIRNKIVTNISVVKGKLQLTTDSYQVANLSSNTTLVLPNATKPLDLIVEIKPSADITLTYPSGVKWQGDEPSIISGNIYEIYLGFDGIDWIGGWITYTVKATVISSFTADKQSPQVSGTKVTLTAKATGTGTLQYKFSIQDEEGNWAILRDYGTSNTFIWTTGATGNKTLYVDVKDSNGKVTRKSMSYTVTQ